MMSLLDMEIVGLTTRNVAYVVVMYLPWWCGKAPDR